MLIYMCVYIYIKPNSRIEKYSFADDKGEGFWKLVGISEELGMTQAAPSHMDWKKQDAGDPGTTSGCSGGRWPRAYAALSGSAVGSREEC